jgi:hypothetical protein
MCGVAVLASVVLAACGSSPAPTTAPVPGASATASATPSPSVSPGAAATEAVLCRDTKAVTGLEIIHHVIRVPQLQIAFPGQVIVATPAQARAVARALCALPLFPRGVVMSCPALLVGTTYLLQFTADGRRLPDVTVEATGCQTVTGVGPERWAARSPGFWRILAEAAGMSPPGRSVFTETCHSTRPDQINGCPAQTKPTSGAVP